MPNIRPQLQPSVLSLIALFVALLSVCYLTWRSERTEANRNVRSAAFEVLGKLAELEGLLYATRHDGSTSSESARAGWSCVIAIRDLSELLPERTPTQAAVLQKVWGENWERLGQEENTAARRIADAIDEVREATQENLRALR